LEIILRQKSDEGELELLNEVIFRENSSIQSKKSAFSFHEILGREKERRKK